MADTVCIEYDERVGQYLDQTRQSPVDHADAILIGTDDTDPDYENRELGEEVGEADIAEYNWDEDSRTLVLNAFLGEQQLNDLDSDIAEIGARSEQGRFLCHGTFTPFEKTQERGVQLQITFTFDSSGGE